MTESNSLSKIRNELPDINIDEITQIIASSSAKASAIAALPIPIIDIAGVTFIQVKMVNEIAKKYGVNIDDKTKVIIISFTTTLLSRLITEATNQIASSVNVDKLMGETLIKATFSGFTTTITGEVYANHFKQGGTFDDLSLDKTLDYFKSQINSDRVSIENLAESAMSAISEKFNF